MSDNRRKTAKTVGDFQKHALMFAQKIGKWSWLVVVLVIVCLILHVNFDKWIDSDASSELILARLLNEEGAVITKNWYYSTELRVLNTQLVFAPLFSFFKDWHAIRFAGTMILYGILLLSYVYFCKQARIFHICPWTAPLLFIPFSYDYWRFTLVGAFCIPYMAITFGVLGFIFHILHSTARWKKFLLLAIASGVSYLAGAGGMREILCLYIPLFVCAFILWCMKVFLPEVSSNAQERDFYTCFLLIAVIVTFFAGIGCVWNIKILWQEYRFLKFNSINFQDFSLNKLETIISGYLKALGYRGDGRIFSVNLIYNAINGSMVLTLICALIYSYKRRAKLSCDKQIVVLFSVSAFAIFSIFYLLTDMYFEQRYMFPVLISALPVVGIFFQELPWKKWSKRIVCFLFGLLITVSSFVYMARENYSYLEILKPISSELVQDGYNTGYATFWNANVLTELTDGQIDVYALSNRAEDIKSFDEIYQWLQVKDHFENPPHGKLFVIFSAEELERLTVAKALEGSDIFYQNYFYTVYTFDSYEELTKRVEKGT